MKNEKNDNKKKNSNTNNIKEIKGGVCAAKGFFANGIYSGIKKKKTSKDLAIIYSESLCAVTMRELGDGVWKFSLRTGERVNATEVCRLLGGGGHARAAGATLEGVTQAEAEEKMLNAIARLGVFAVMWISPMIASKFNGSVVAPVGFCTALLCVGLLFFLTFTFMDRKFDSQLVEAGLMTAEKSPEDEFHLSDLGKIFSSKMFWIVALLCVLYYSAIFPFQRYAPNYLEITLGVSAETASRLFSCFPILAMVLTPFLGAFLDFKGKGASMLMLGAIIMIVCHLSFAFLLPAFPSKALALVLIVTLGVSFSLVPAALWPSVPKIIDEKILGSAYCLIFWVQNIGLCLVPLLIGATLQATGGYMVPMIIFSTFGVLAFILSFMLKFEDRKKGYGLELPNVKE